MFVIIGERSRAASDSRQNLCLKCWNYHGRKYAIDDSEVHLCCTMSNHPQRLRGPVSQCSDFQDKSKPNKHELDKIAWIIDPNHKKVGFIPPSERKDLKHDD